MSNSLAIASVTATLRRLLEKGGIDHVTVRPLDKAPVGIAADKQRINLFLYQALPDAAFRNMEMPGRAKSGETGHPPLPLTLYYLLTAYSGDEQDDTKSHALLGEAMRIFHDHPLLGAGEIRDAVTADRDLAASDLADQVERLRITLQPLLFEEMSKLWTTFQIHYRLSAAYQVSVVLIESTRPVRTPLPVLMRGKDDRGVMVQPDLTPPFPTLTEVAVPKREPSQKLADMTKLPKQPPTALLGDELLIKGHHLGDSEVVVDLIHPLIKKAVEIPVKNGTDKELKTTVPNKPTELPAGFYTVAAHITPTDPAKAGDERKTNSLSLSLAPTIVDIKPKILKRDALLTVQCRPEIWEGQRVALLVGDRELISEPWPAKPARPEELPRKTDTMKFRLKNIGPGTYFVRLRVDGVDSLLVDWSKTPPEFDTTKKVTVQ
ncbi:MAG: DUF4255 domain-containing protein [Nitrospira sp.]|nr:DUF4255 domain-containing protein [Nitrospira sp.]